MIAPFFIHANLSKPFNLEMDAFGFAIGVIFSQLGKNNIFHLVNFCFRKFSLLKINYEIHDKKIITFVDAFQEWCHLLEGTQHGSIVYSNHKNLQYFMTNRVLNQHQV
jgi:hypothetical protein